MSFFEKNCAGSVPIRPLDNVSDFVVDTLPMALTEDPARFEAQVSAVAAGLSADRFERYAQLTGDAMRIACLDLAMLHQACGHRGATLPAPLNLLFSRLSQRIGRLPAFLYEDCVLNNPVERDPRVFSAGDAGACEREFLHLHRGIEASLETSLQCLDALAQSHDRPGLIARCEAKIREVMAGFAAFHRMPREQFHAFRNYYAAFPGSRHPGVSGRFSETVATLRILIEGSRLLWVIPGYFNEIVEHQHYYPTVGRARLLAAIERAVLHDGSAMDYLCAEDPAVHRLVACVRKLMDTITGIHYQLVKKYVD